MRDTHFLERAGQGLVRTRKDNGREGHSLSGDGRSRHLVRTRKQTERLRRTHKLETIEGGTWSGHRNKLTDQGALTAWRQQREGLGQDTETNRLTKAHSHPGEGRGRDLSGHGNQPTSRGVLTFWRRQMEELVRTWKETDQQRRTH